VLAVDVDENAVVLCDIDGPPPAVGEMLFLYPPRFLESLKIAWQDAAWVAQINAWLAEALARTQARDAGVSLAAFPWLRQGQKATESLPGWPISFVWGPPGTGKTSFIKALANYTKRHIVTISLKMIKTKN
jgi:SpoVK/Ycf46/Vps4 family AAA+-type ATPase